jgi:hypothetical protein
MPYTPTPIEIAAALSDVAYEIEQILGGLVTWAPTDPITHNARLEALLLHTRVLLDFFEHSRREHDNVLATDYEFSAASVPLDPKLRERLNKDLAHLTYSRQQRLGPAKGWNLKQLLTPLLERCSQFADHVVATRLNSLPADQQLRWRELAASLKASWLGPAV